MDDKTIQLVIDQMNEVQVKHPALGLEQESDGQLRVRGPVGFTISHDGNTIKDTYQIELHIPDDYPDSPPFVYETDGKVPKEFGHFMEAGNFCLGAPVEIRRRFAEHRKLITFIDDQVIPYLFTNSYKRELGKLPFGDRKHGYFMGLLDYYIEYFGVGELASLKLLKCLADQFAPPLRLCPCGSGKKLKDCHGPKLDELRPHLTARQFERELRYMIKEGQMSGYEVPEHVVMPERLWKRNRNRITKKTKTHKRRKQTG